MSEFAIVGLGSWGLCVLERSVNRARHTASSICVHVVEPGQLGGGVYSAAQPDYLILNNPCGQLSLYAAPDEDEDPAYAMGLYEWALEQGYRRVGYEYKIGVGGETIQPTDYLPRRLMGEYLAWFYETLVADAPSNLEIVRHYAAGYRHHARARRSRDGTARQRHADQRRPRRPDVGAHVQRRARRRRRARCVTCDRIPVEHFDAVVAPGEPIAIAGMGLVGYDLVTALTVGRGGTYEEVGDGLRYVPSGREPEIYLYSRSGRALLREVGPRRRSNGRLPAGRVHAGGVSRDDESRRVRRLRRRVDFRNDLLPLLFAEMQVRYYIHSAYLTRRPAGGGVGSRSARVELERAGPSLARWIDLEPTYGRFDPASVVFADAGARSRRATPTSRTCTRWSRRTSARRWPLGGSPVKAAQEVTRILRDQMRTVIEYGGLSHAVLHRLSIERSRPDQPDRGGPAATSLPTAARAARRGRGPDSLRAASRRLSDRRRRGLIRSTTPRHEPVEASVKHVVRGHLDLPSLARSSSPLLSSPLRQGSPHPVQLRRHDGGQRRHQ